MFKGAVWRQWKYNTSSNMDTGIAGSSASVDKLPHNRWEESFNSRAGKRILLLTIGRRVETSQEFKSVNWQDGQRYAV